MPLNTEHCWSQQNIRFDYAFTNDPHHGNDKFVYVRKSVRRGDVVDISLKLRWKEGIRRYDLHGFVDGIIARVKTLLQTRQTSYRIEREKPNKQMRTITVFNVPMTNHWDVAEIIGSIEIVNAHLEWEKAHRVENVHFVFTIRAFCLTKSSARDSRLAKHVRSVIRNRIEKTRRRTPCARRLSN